MDKFSLPAVHTNNFSCSKSWHDHLLNKTSCSKEKLVHFILYTRANKTCQGETCQGKLGGVCGALSDKQTMTYDVCSVITALSLQL